MKKNPIQSTSYKMMNKNDICANVHSDCAHCWWSIGDWSASSWMSWKIIAQNVMSTVCQKICTAEKKSTHLLIHMHARTLQMFCAPSNSTSAPAQNEQTSISSVQRYIHLTLFRLQLIFIEFK